MNPLAGALASAVGALATAVGGAWLLRDAPAAKTSIREDEMLCVADQPIEHNKTLNKQYVALHNVVVEACRLHAPFQPVECAALMQAVTTFRAHLQRLAAWGKVATRESTDRLALSDIDLFQQDLNAAERILCRDLYTAVQALRNPSLDLRFARIYRALGEWITRLGNLIVKNIQVHARRNLIRSAHEKP